MRYGFSINDGPALVGNRDEVAAAFVGVLLASSDWGVDILDAQSLTEAALKKADQDPGETISKAVRIGDMVYRTIQIWRERGKNVKGRYYLVQVGKDASFRTGDTNLLINFIAGLMVSDGVGLEKSTALGKNVAFALSEGIGYPDRVVTNLGDGREVRAWFEDGTEGAL